MKRRSFLQKATAGTAFIGTLGILRAKNEKSLIERTSSGPDKNNGKYPVRVAVVQQDGNPGHVKENRDKALHYATEALEQRSDVILFHEELLVGYVENLKELAEPLNGPTTRAFQNLLKGTNAKVIYGLTEKEGEDYYISAPVISENGVLANYRKTHLWWRSEGLRCEPDFYNSGNDLVTFDLKGFKCGIMICYDGDFPEMARSYANLGCSMLFWMNNRQSRGHEEVKLLASHNSLIMLVSCCCGLDEQGKDCPGGSNITGAEGELIAELWDDEGIVISDVFPEYVEQLRRGNYNYRGLRPDVYYYGSQTI